MSLIDRKRKIDIEGMTSEQATKYGESFGDRLREVSDEAIEKVKKILKSYGIEDKVEVKMQVALKKK